MKKLYTLLGLSLILCFQFAQAQTYNINTATNPAVGGVCPGNTGIDNTYDCAFDNQPAINIGDFTDTNPVGSSLVSMDLLVYGACSGGVTFFLNGTQIATGTATGLSCSCQSIASDPNIPQSYTVAVTPAISSAFVAGGTNTLSVSSNNSAAGAQCFYGADVTLVAGPAATVPTMSQWGLILFGLVLVAFGVVAVWRKKSSTSMAA